MKSLTLIAAVVVIGSAVFINTAVYAKERTTGRGTGPVVYVTSQGLFYDSIVIVESLPQEGRFQELVAGEEGLTTEFGPGDHGHVGGRWWIDLNEDGVMDADDSYFLCPLLGPGRETL